MRYKRSLGTVTIIILVLAGSAYATFQWVKQEWAAVALGDDAKDFFDQSAALPDFVSSQREPCKERHPLRHPYFGALHVHTAVSYDSASWLNTITPSQSYAFMRGEKVPFITRDTPSQKLGQEQEQERFLQLPRALDFGAVTDHAEYFGEGGAMS